MDQGVIFGGNHYRSSLSQEKKIVSQNIRNENMHLNRLVISCVNISCYLYGNTYKRLKKKIWFRLTDNRLYHILYIHVWTLIL